MTGARTPADALPVAGDRRPPLVAAAPIAEARAVVRRLAGVAAVDGVSLALAPGEVVGLLGANGAGKTTLIRMLLGLLRASEGEVRLFGEPPSRATRARIG